MLPELSSNLLKLLWFGSILQNAAEINVLIIKKYL